jgi:hypothetical protein
MAFKSFQFESVAELMTLVNEGKRVSAAAVAPAPGSGGTGYELNDLLTVSGGADAFASAVLKVTGVAAGVITSVSVVNEGAYPVAPTNPVSASGGKGQGASFNLTTVAAVADQAAVERILNRNGQWYVGYWT